MSSNNGIFINGILRSELLNIPFASCSFINLDFLLPHKAHFDDNIILSFFVNFCFKNLDFLATQLAHFDVCLITLFVTITFLNEYYQYAFYNLNNKLDKFF